MHKLPNLNLKKHLPLIFLLALPGCLRSIRITSNTYADVRTIPTGFPLWSSFSISSPRSGASLLAREIGWKIEQLLDAKGFQISDSDDEADFRLQFDYEMSESTRMVPVPCYIPGKTVTTHGAVYGKKILGYEEQVKTSDTLVFVDEERIFFTKKLNLQVYENRLNRRTLKKELVWQGSAVSCDENDDLREAIDYLLKAAFKSFGKNTHRKIDEIYGM